MSDDFYFIFIFHQLPTVQSDNFKIDKNDSKSSKYQFFYLGPVIINAYQTTHGFYGNFSLWKHNFVKIVFLKFWKFTILLYIQWMSQNLLPTQRPSTISFVLELRLFHTSFRVAYNFSIINFNTKFLNYKISIFVILKCILGSIEKDLEFYQLF